MGRGFNKAERLLRLEHLLVAHPEGIRRADIARRLGVHRSTVGRDIDELSRRVPIWEDDNLLGINRDDYLTHVRLTMHESMALHLAARMMATRMDKHNPHAASALRKLGVALEKLAPLISTHLAASADVMDDAAQRHDPVYLEVLETLTRAWSQGQMVHLWHRHEESGRVYEYDFAPYFIEPYAVGQTTHVIGWREPPVAKRTLKVERIQRIQLIERTYAVPEDFDPRELLADAWGIWYTEVEPVEVVLKFHPRVAGRVRETRWHRSERVEEQPDGSLLWRAKVAEPQEMLPWVRGWGADVEVVEPEALRKELIKTTRLLARRYDVIWAKSEPEIEQLLQCWGKTSQVSEDFHPALFHMLDVGCVAQALLRPPSSPRWRKILAIALGTEPEMLSIWLPYVIAMHDIGKISAAFQFQNKAQYRRLEAQGFPLKPWRANLDIHHSQIGQVFVQEQTLNLIVPDDFRQVWVDTVGGHHGQFRPRSGIKQAGARLRKHEPPMWRQHREVADSILQRHILPPGLYSLPKPDNISTATMALTGFTILCDWVGSDERFFPAASEWDLESYTEESRARAERAVQAAGFLQLAASEAPTTFAALFPDKHPPRPLQTAIDAIPQEVVDGPCLAIIEAPTGEGKTEAALALAHRLAGVSSVDELYYALPTTATSNQMFKRLQEHLRNRLGLPVDVQLIHGQAYLLSDDLRIEPLDSDERADRDAMIEWFTSKKRALLAPFGVGTIDQAEFAALNVKHNALRLIGLAGKVVIFDEVHAYDTYMTTIVETLLQWLSALGTSVIILSATLPRAQRTRLAQAYGVAMQATSENQEAYPSLWLLRSGHAAYHAAPPAQQPDRPLAVRTLHQPDEAADAKAEWLLDAVAEGGCACWITNTVDRAQQLFLALDNADTPGVDLTLMHARFPLEDRQKREEQLTEKYGPPAGERPPRGIVVGTQVLEQSLDLDFDVMVSDLAPIDLLLQRAGRLQRHDRPRPTPYADHPTLWVHTQLSDGGAPDLGVDRWIYDAFLLHQTWLTLQAWGGEIHLPHDYRPLIEAVYGISSLSPDSPLIETWRQLQQKQSKAEKEARLRLIPKPDSEWSFCSRVAQLTFEEDETGAAWIVAQSRIGRESVNLIPLEREGEHARLYPSDEMVPLDRPASKEMQLRLLRRHLRVSRPEIVRATKVETLPKLFTQSARLKGYYPLWLTDGQTEFPFEKGKLIVTLDDTLGLVIQAKKGV